ncbi:MAG: hypothetical protein LLG08_02480 [Actinomycetia bacterium]|nr:hypothetical protein [Actinomycetes bacterium]
MAARRLAMAGLALVILCGSLVALGCRPQTDTVTLVVPLRDDYAPADVEALQSMLLSDQRVLGCRYVHENVMLAEDATSANGTSTPGPEGDPSREAWFEIDVARGSQEAVLESLESHPSFERAVLVRDQGDWWQVR